MLKEILDGAVTLSQRTAICYAFPASDRPAPCAHASPATRAFHKPSESAPAKGTIGESGLRRVLQRDALRRPRFCHSATDRPPKQPGLQEKESPAHAWPTSSLEDRNSAR